MKSTLFALSLAVGVLAVPPVKADQCEILILPNHGLRPVPTQKVPDAGTSMGLMAISSLGLAWMSRKVRRSQ